MVRLGPEVRLEDFRRDAGIVYWGVYWGCGMDASKSRVESQHRVEYTAFWALT